MGLQAGRSAGRIARRTGASLADARAEGQPRSTVPVHAMADGDTGQRAAISAT